MHIAISEGSFWARASRDRDERRDPAGAAARTSTTAHPHTTQHTRRSPTEGPCTVHRRYCLFPISCRLGRGQAGSADRNDDGDAPGPEARSEETLEGSGRQAGRDARPCN